METAQEHKPNQYEKPKSHVWDCGSTLYDSFELNSFKRQLDSAMATRTFSMSRIPDRQAPPPPPPQASKSKKTSKLSRSLHKFLRSVFKPKPSPSSVVRVQDQPKDGFYFVYDKSGALTTIPEAPEIDFSKLSPEVGSLVRKSASERFTATPIGISCA
ncbi:hypothetical protein ACB098_01G143700 [Castanea mollissima]|uniref:Uncharacterized protein n=1 Tax=Castanea mollissima TaxID=60419 RepID=A0A8J4VSK2_9ROSI|nr:hypothetical protein CMV_015481 [Castanea mollissima]